MSNVLKVTEVKAASQGEKLGILIGDIILSYSGTSVDSNIALSNAIYNAKESGKTNSTLRIRRGEQVIELEVTTDSLGINCTEVAEIRPKGTAYESGTDYKTSISVAKAVSAIGWLVCIVAIVIVFSAIAAAGRMGALAIAPGLGVLIGGLILVIAGQSSRAVMDNTNYSRLMLEEMRKKA